MATQTQKREMKKLAEFRKQTGIGFTDTMRGKMEGMIALSTSPNGNPACLARAGCGNPNCICPSCYAMAQMAYQHETEAKLEQNGKILSERLIPMDEWVHLNPNAWRLVRIEAHGDVRNATHAANYMRLAKANPHITFVAWTKNYWFYAQAVKSGTEKPDNFILIVSSPMMNDELDIEKYPLADRVFTVYTGEYITENGIKPQFINCGARSCLACKHCYKRDNGLVYIHEILKKDKNAVYRHWVANGDLALQEAERELGKYLAMGAKWDKANPTAKHLYARPSKAA